MNYQKIDNKWAISQPPPPYRDSTNPLNLKSSWLIRYRSVHDVHSDVAGSIEEIEV
ncbi:MAG: hypothetical protein KME28_20410 [Pelatocladus maniniholoensis HA4357-MV3]|jgi:hypothetical protein|uniref:Uncharacterized protein n=1 Tax=Pelatocladus maniniholoensis HA4357-MV3 TaxID=1117104 RepID=A0A9E3LUN4_9NOST|nr:hypothetical protein [Pelatocladus maniniholoensis HA4357-MV3]